MLRKTCDQTGSILPSGSGDGRYVYVVPSSNSIGLPGFRGSGARTCKIVLVKRNAVSTSPSEMRCVTRAAAFRGYSVKRDRCFSSQAISRAAISRASGAGIMPAISTSNVCTAGLSLSKQTAPIAAVTSSGATAAIRSRYWPSGHAGIRYEVLETRSSGGGYLNARNLSRGFWHILSPDLRCF